MDDCEVCGSGRATITVLVNEPDETLEVCQGCMDSTGYSEGWVDYDYYVETQANY